MRETNGEADDEGDGMRSPAQPQVLCVDDDPDILEGLRLQLSDRYRVLTALDGEQGLRHLGQNPDIEVVISDMRMPGMDGAGFLTRARMLAPNAGRILLSGQTDLRSAIVAVNEAQVLRFLSKPCSPAELHAAVQAALEQRRQANLQSTELHRRLAEQMVNRDALTGLASRTRFHELLEGACAEADGREHSGTFTLLLVQLQNVRDIAAVNGESVHDHVLQVIARRLTAHCPNARAIARWGDEEFAVLERSDSADEPALLAAADALIAQLAVPIEHRSLAQRLRVRASIGIAGVPLHTRDAHTLMKFAAIAARQARLQGGGITRVFRADWAYRVEHRYQLLMALREAIEADALHLHYQPIIDLKHGCVRSFEALARWQHPTLGAVPPAQFITLAEESGEMPPLGQWILRRACREARALAGRYCARVAVNVSVQQLLHDGFLGELDAALGEASLDPRELELEMTESVLSRDTDRVLAVVSQLRDRGISVAVDDFGTGYSSLSYLQRFPADALKIDSSFVAALGQGGETIITAALSIGRSFGMQVVVEGVETDLQRRQLRALGAHLLQGFLYCRPLPLDAIDAWFCSSAFAAAPNDALA